MTTKDDSAAYRASADSYVIYGGLGSPYSVKVRALLRYRRLPHSWVQVNEFIAPQVLSKVKAPVIPVLHFPDLTWMNDSTPLAHALEARHPGERSIIPDDPVQAFLCSLFEDMADEWGTKLMFHYRWYRERDQLQTAEWLMFDRLAGSGRAVMDAQAAAFRKRQVGRMALVGCTPGNAPLIEASAQAVMQVLQDTLVDEPFFFGSRPSLADFAWFGQLAQLANDPTPSELMRERYPLVYRWLMNVDDLSGHQGDWLGADKTFTPRVLGMVKLVGRYYMPFLLANAAAIARAEETFRFEVDGSPYEQGVFKYQAKCLAELRSAYAALAARDKARLDPVLAEAGVLAGLV